MYKSPFLYILISILVLASCCRKLNSKIHASTIDSNVARLRLYTYGGPPDLEKLNAENTITAKWGIEIQSVAGCMVDKVLRDSVAENNEIVEKAIQKIYGLA